MFDDKMQCYYCELVVKVKDCKPPNPAYACPKCHHILFPIPAVLLVSPYGDLCQLNTK